MSMKFNVPETLKDILKVSVESDEKTIQMVDFYPVSNATNQLISSVIKA